MISKVLRNPIWRKPLLWSLWELQKYERRKDDVFHMLEWRREKCLPGALNLNTNEYLFGKIEKWLTIVPVSLVSSFSLGLMRSKAPRGGSTRNVCPFLSEKSIKLPRFLSNSQNFLQSYDSNFIDSIKDERESWSLLEYKSDLGRKLDAFGKSKGTWDKTSKNSRCPTSQFNTREYGKNAEKLLKWISEASFYWEKEYSISSYSGTEF